MIRINGDWFVDIDKYNYTLCRDLHKKRTIKKNGEDVEEDAYAAIGHFSSLDKALERLGEEVIRYKLMDGVYTLNVAVTAIRECRDEWRRLVEEIRRSER